MKIIASGPSDGPSIPTAAAFFDLMNEIEAFQDQNTEHLCFEHYEALSEAIVTLRTLGNLVSSDSPIDYIISLLRQAEMDLDEHRQQVQLSK